MAKEKSFITLTSGVHFFLKKKSRDNFDKKADVGVRRLKFTNTSRAAESKKPLTHMFKKCFRAVGTQASYSTVNYTLPSGDMIRIRTDKRSIYGDDEVAWDFKRLHKVTFVIGITFAGPIAYDVQQYQPSVIGKIQNSPSWRTIGLNQMSLSVIIKIHQNLFYCYAQCCFHKVSLCRVRLCSASFWWVSLCWVLSC